MKLLLFSRVIHHPVRMVLTLCVCFSFILNGQSQNDGIPRGAQLPYLRYEAEDGSFGGGAQLQQAPDYDQNLIASEASNQKYVSLPSNGSYVQWTTTAIAQGVTLRFTMPDNSTGVGLNGSLSFYVGNTKVKTINLSSYWAYQYFPSGQYEPVQTYSSGCKTFMRFDEVHFLLDNKIPAGSVIKIVKENGDALTYGIDFVELEDVPAPLSAPTNSLSVTAYGATPDDNSDDLAAFNACLSAAASQGKNMYIPAGRYILSDKWIVNVSNIKIQGAGIWYTELYFSTNKQFYGGIMARSNNVEISDFYLNTANNGRFKYDEPNSRVPGDPYKIYKGFMGTYGSNSKIHDVWIEHFECGMWIGGYDPPYPIDVTDGLIISRARIRNNYADGVNFCQGTSNSVVEYSSIRNEGDDGLAMWPNNYMNAPQERNNIFRYCTIENNWRAGGIAIFGGTGHQVYRCVIKDGVAGSAIRFTNDFPGYTFEQNAPKIICTDNYIVNCGTSYDLWNQKRGAIELYTPNGIYDVEFNNTIIINSQRHAIQLYGSIQNMVFNNTTIDGTGMDAFVDQPTMDDWGGFGILAQASGNVTFNNVSFNRIESFTGTDPVWGNIKNHNTAFQIIINNTNVPLTGINLDPTTLSIPEGKTAQLSVTFTPTNATNKNLLWTSSNNNVATVSSAGTGIATVTAQSVGNCTITVTSADGNFSKTCAVTVTPAVNITATVPDAAEGATAGIFTISTSAPSSNIVVGYTISGTASSSDYTPNLSGSVTLSPAIPSVNINITPVDDNIFEGNESLTLTLQPGTNYSLGGNTVATITIADNDNPPCTAPVIAYTSTTPIVDQNIDAVWNIAPATTINYATIGTKSGEYSGQWRALYDNNRLYILVEVDDTQKINDSGSNWWEDDVVEVFIDGDNSKGSTYDHVNDFQLGFRWNDANINVGGNSVTNIAGIQYTMTGTSTGYRLEASIPWTTIGVSPTIGQAIGFEIEIDDDDNGGTRDAQIASFATSTDAWSNPSLFGTVYLTTCSGNVVPVTGVTLNQSTANINVGSTLQLTATVQPANATNKNVTWSSSNPLVATVNSSGLVTAVAAGTAIITVTTQDGEKTATCTVTVNSTNVPVTGVTINQSTANINVGSTLQLTATVQPANATNKNVTWSSSNPLVATVNSSGLVTAVAAGIAIITVTTQDGEKTATCSVTVLAATSQTPYNGTPISIPGTIEAENFDNGGQNISYYDTDPTNNGGQYRTSEAVDIEVCSNGGFNVGWMYADEWIEYTINVTTAGNYHFDCRVASAIGGSFNIMINDLDKTGNITVPNTGGWQTWQSVIISNISLSAGTQILKIFSNGGLNIDKIIITAQSNTSTYRIKNRWQNTYLYDAGDRVRYSTTANNNTYNWILEDIGNNQIEIKNEGTNEYMHIENLLGYVQCTPRTVGWMSSRWTLEDAGSGYIRIRNVWQPNYYVHIENLQNQAQYGTINSTWWSAMWQLEPVVNSSSMPVSVENSTIEAFQLFPNPVYGNYLNIKLNQELTHIFYMITDLSGKQLLNGKLLNIYNPIDISSLSAGTYIITIQSNELNYKTKLIRIK